jgi:hypothetical protein
MHRGRRGGNGRVDAEVNAVKLPEPRRGWVCQTQQHAGDEHTHRCCQYQTYKVEGPNHALASEGPAEKVSTTVAAHGAMGYKAQHAVVRVDEVGGDEMAWLCWTKKQCG